MRFFKLWLEVITLVFDFGDYVYDYRIIISIYIINLILMIYLLATVWDEEEDTDDNKKAMVEDWFTDFFN